GRGGGGRERRGDEGVVVAQRAGHERLFLFPLVADLLRQRRQKTEGDVGRLVVLRLGRRDVAAEGAERRRRREERNRQPLRQARGVDPRDQSRRRRLEVPLHAGDLPREEQVGAAARLERR